MSRLPPALLYLTIYNPSLRPTGPGENTGQRELDEDAEEQAHILFYTARERAVSRDRMLRQIGLAKALVNFAEMFSPEQFCDNVHSQTRRMIMVSPEPNYWIHACFELAKTPKPPPPEKGKGKGKEKEKERGKAQAKPKEPETSYDYHDSSLNDLALREYLLRGYDEFKLKYGSFTSIMTTLGQHALELQLERFFTVWAWKWDIDEDLEFGSCLGPPLHPSYRAAQPILDAYSPSYTPFIITSSHVLPSTRFLRSKHSTPLSRHLLSLLSPALITSTAHTPTRQTLSKEQYDVPPNLQTPTESGSNASTIKSGADAVASLGAGLLPLSGIGMPGISGVNLDVRKWNWSGYMSFGRGFGKKTVGRSKSGQEEPKSEAPDPSDSNSVPGDAADPVLAEGGTPTPDGSEAPESADNQMASTEGESRSSTESGSLAPPPLARASMTQTSMPTLPPPFLATTVYLPGEDDPSGLETRKRKVFYLSKKGLMLVLLWGEEDNWNDDVLRTLSERAVPLLRDVQRVLDEEEARRQTADSQSTSVSKILQPKDRYVVLSNDFAFPSPDFKSDSEYLFNGRQMLERDPGIQEIFSRGQNPQHWHISKRGLGTSRDGVTVHGEVYMEVMRKETSLQDVDNEVVGAARRFAQG